MHISDKKCFEDAIFFNALFESAIFLREQFFMEEQFFFLGVKYLISLRLITRTWFLILSYQIKVGNVR